MCASAGTVLAAGLRSTSGVGTEDGLRQPIALEAAPGELGVRHLRQRFEARGGKVSLLDHRIEAGEDAAKSLHCGREAGNQSGNYQIEHRYPFHLIESVHPQYRLAFQ